MSVSVRELPWNFNTLKNQLIIISVLITVEAVGKTRVERQKLLVEDLRVLRTRSGTGKSSVRTVQRSTDFILRNGQSTKRSKDRS